MECTPHLVGAPERPLGPNWVQNTCTVGHIGPRWARRKCLLPLPIVHIVPWCTTGARDSKTGGCRFDSCRACFSIACSAEVASGFPNAPAEPLAQVAARLAGGPSLGLLEPAEGLPGGAPRAGARAPAACTTARDTAGKQVPDCRCGPSITAGNGAPSAPRARRARDPALCVDVGRVAAGRSLHGALRDRRRPRCRLAWRSRTTPRVILRRVASARDSLHHPHPPNCRGPPTTGRTPHLPRNLPQIG